jgi:phage shock protein C
MISGVCGGLGEYFGIDATIVRLVFVLGLFLTLSTTFWVYLIMMIVVPEEPSNQTYVPPQDDNPDLPA